MRDAVIFHLVSGQAWFTGTILLAAAARMGLSDRKKVQAAARVLSLLAALLLVVSSTPIPWWILPAWGILLAYWWISFRKKELDEKRRRRLAWGMAMFAVAGMALELVWEWPPEIPPLQPGQTLTILGDSVTAGMGDEEFTWPELLAERVSYKVADRAHVGATVGSTLKKLPEIDIPPGIVLIELGGNDLLGSGDADEFERHLSYLLRELSDRDCTLVMFELPLPPLYHGFGYAQRKLARRHGVILIPKRYLLSVLLSPDTTLDSIHLSPEGHRKMAAMVGELVEDAE